MGIKSMNKQILLFLFISILICFQSCKTSSVDEIHSIKESKLLEGKNIDNIKNLCYNGIIANDSILLINDWCSDSVLFSAYDAHSFKHLGNFCHKGVGPNEFLSPFFTRNIISSNSQLEFSIYDLNRKKYAEYAITKKKLSDKNKLKPLLFVDSPESIFPCMNLTRTDKYYIAQNIQNNNELFSVFNKKTNSKIIIDYKPITKNKVDDNQWKNLISTNTLIANEQKSKIVCCLKYYNRILIYNYDGELLKELQLGESIDPVPGKNYFNVSENSFIYSLDAYATDQYFYVLWGGLSKKSYNTNQAHHSYVLCFNWDGDLVNSFKLPRSILIAINQSNTTLFSVSYGTNNNLGIKYYTLNLMK